MVSESRKKKILEESFREDAVCSEVARKYGISPEKLYTWRSKYRHKQNLMSSENVKICDFGIDSAKHSGEFVEVHLQNTEDVAGSKLQGVSFNFTDYVVQISGKIDDRIIGSILKISGIN